MYYSQRATFVAQQPSLFLASHSSVQGNLLRTPRAMRKSSGLNFIADAGDGKFGSVIRHVRRGGNINEQDQVLGFSAVMAAAKAGRAGVLTYLIRKGARINLQNKEGRNALMLAVANNHFDCVTILLMECDADRNDVDRNGWAAQFIAARKGYWNILYALIDWGADVDVCDKAGFTVLMIAVGSGDASVVMNLVEKGALLQSKNKAEQTALHLAARAGNTEVIHALNKFGNLNEIVNKKDKNNMSALELAVQYGHEAAAELLRELGAEPAASHRFSCEPTRDTSGPSDDRDDEGPTHMEVEHNTHVSPWTCFRPSGLSTPSAMPLPTPLSVTTEKPTRKRLREEVAAFDPARAAQVNAEYTAAWCGDREAFVRLSTAEDEPLAKGYVALLKLFTEQYRDETRGLSLAEEVLPWLENAGQTCPHALFVLATLKYHGKAAAQDVSTAVNAFSHLTMHHHANAQCALARHFDDTANGSPQQEMFALCMYIKAAAQDHPEGLFRLALHFLVQPHRTKEDEELAVGYLRRAAVRGHPAALQHLGDCLQHGVGALRDLRGAVLCYKSSAERHDALGLSCLAECTATCLYTGMSHFNGADGLARCDTSAHKYFSLALHGEEDTAAEAAYMLGLIAWHGLVTEQDVNRAEEFFINAASKGHVRAKIELALLLTFVKNTQDARTKAVDPLAELAAAAVIDMKIPFVVGEFLRQSRNAHLQGGGKCAVLVRCLRPDADGTFDYRPDQDPLNTNAHGGLKNCAFLTDLQWVETAAPLLKVGLLHLALHPARHGMHWHLDVQRALRMLQAPMRQPNRTVAVTCWCDADEPIGKAYDALGDMVTFDELDDTDERLVRRQNLRSVATTLF